MHLNVRDFNVLIIHIRLIIITEMYLKKNTFVFRLYNNYIIFYKINIILLTKYLQKNTIFNNELNTFIKKDEIQIKIIKICITQKFMLKKRDAGLLLISN